jgi:CRP-like cAMP-binding protein
VSLLEFLSTPDLELVKQRMVRKEFRKGEYLFRENSRSRGIYVLRKGKVKIFQTNSEGKQSIVYIYGKGDFFGHRPILGDEAHPVSAVAMDNVVVSYISKDLFVQLLEKSSSLARKLLGNLSKEFSVWVNKMTFFSQYNLKKRVALSLLIFNRIYERGNTSMKTTISINRDDFASFVGTAKETVVRMLRQFKDEGIIRSKRTNIVILKPKSLVSTITAEH